MIALIEILKYEDKTKPIVTIIKLAKPKKIISLGVCPTSIFHIIELAYRYH